MNNAERVELLVLRLEDFPHAALADFPLNAVVRNVLTDFRHEILPLKKAYMLLGFVERSLGLIISTGGQYLKRNPSVIANRLNGASTGAD